MTNPINNIQDVCRQYEAAVEKKKGQLTTQEFSKFIEDLTFAEDIARGDVARELQHTVSVQGKADILAREYAKFAKKESSNEETRIFALKSIPTATLGRKARAMVRTALNTLSKSGHTSPFINRVLEAINSIKMWAKGLSGDVRSSILKDLESLQTATDSGEIAKVKGRLTSMHSRVDEFLRTRENEPGFDNLKKIREELTNVLNKAPDKAPETEAEGEIEVEPKLESPPPPAETISAAPPPPPATEPIVKTEGEAEWSPAAKIIAQDLAEFEKSNEWEEVKRKYNDNITGAADANDLLDEVGLTGNASDRHKVLRLTKYVIGQARRSGEHHIDNAEHLIKKSLELYSASDDREATKAEILEVVNAKGGNRSAKARLKKLLSS